VKHLVDLIEGGARERVYGSAYFTLFEEERILVSYGTRGVSSASIFDIASVTKIFTALLCSFMANESLLSPGTPLRDFPCINVPPEKEEITVEMLLSHKSGLPPYYPLFEIPRLEGGGNRVKSVEAILGLPLQHAPGEKIEYSDMGYILLGFLMEEVGGLSLRDLLKKSITGPLGLRDTMYLPLEELPDCEQGRIISTGFCNKRGREKVGEVDDLNSWAMGGVSGHAGIFSTGHDLFLLSRELIKTYLGEGVVFMREPLLFLLSPVKDSHGCTRRLGFDIPSGEKSLAGDGFSKMSGGHLGFTGVSIWLDFEDGKGMVFLTNRPCKDGNREALNGIRREVHNRAWKVIGR